MVLRRYVKTPSKIKAFLNAEDGRIMKVQTDVKRVLFLDMGLETLLGVHFMKQVTLMLCMSIWLLMCNVYTYNATIVLFFS